MRILQNARVGRRRPGLRSFVSVLAFGVALGFMPDASASTIEFTTPVNLSNNLGKARESRDDQESGRRLGRKARRVGNHVYVAWQDRAGVPDLTGKATEDIFFRFSVNGGVGATWIPQVNIADPTLSEPALNLSNDANVSTEPRLDADDRGNVYLVWQDESVGRVKFRRLLVTGKTAITVVVNDQVNPTPAPGNKRTFPDIALDAQGTVHVAWVQGGRVFYRRSTDQGVNFGTTQTITGSSGPCAAVGSGLEAELAVDNDGRASIVWQNGSTVCYNRVVNEVPGGPPDFPKVVDTNAIADAGPTVVADASGRVHVTWIGKDGVKQRTFYARSTNAGMSFSTLMAMTPSTVPGLSGDDGADKARIAAAGQVVALVWFEKVTNNEVFVARSSDGGASFQGAKVSDPAVSHPAGTHPRAEDPRMAIGADGLVHVAWRQGNGTTVDDAMYARQSAGAGLVFSAPVVISCPDNTAACPGIDPSRVSPKIDDPVVDVDGNGNALVVYDSNDVHGGL
ncbi:MAG: hypothetical protein HYY85_03490 [Deltaproteobacteria bacterium]|nr:hypothetical protein [Deltaproteobacteria bacterium]